MRFAFLNPLSGIIGMAEIALEEDDPSKNRGYLTDILTCRQRIAEIVNGLRSYSRTAKRGELGVIDLHGVLDTSLRMVLYQDFSICRIMEKFNNYY